MAKKKPNIIECDGLIIRGPNGRKRAEIVVEETQCSEQVVSFHMYGDTDMVVPEPALSIYVDGKGEALFRFGYGGTDEDGELQYRTAVRANSGDETRPPRIEYFGRRDDFHGAPTFVLEGENLGRNSAFVTAMVKAAREYSSRYGTAGEDPFELMDEVADVLKFEQETAPREQVTS